jgi:SAM-dependent methyltransferase
MSENVREAVRGHYAEIAREERDGCGCGCERGGAQGPSGYTAEQEAAVPRGADLGLGCGTPLAFAELRPGETVVDLGSGGGVDCFLAADEVGAGGRVIGVDMTPDMLARARRIADENGRANVEFRLGEIEALPVADASVDVVISNCVVNLSPEKERVFREAFRVLKTGGRVAISDIVARQELPEDVRADLELVGACIGGARLDTEVRAMAESAGFTDVRVELRPVAETGDERADRLARMVAPASVTARKP